ncbi:TetR/AcrR family transcriptional regulator [Rhodococcus sp. G-MC3]|uniref:TetR/AcrR family transcriptional regulator n=1 Tax=Rhodococcus sp. G-MC3 TaxID=3046209 RepID=UPI0024B99222|nr:TetR/AcrR family transcriptional regulator [Rhodococcus sp. G-MC3]MDJ0394341.1 TetR/AcrR family transcriptional regulator [Rhodococcus sp. G-MC3]
MGTARTTRARWIDEGLAVLVEGGSDAVRVEVLAKRIGVTKGGFYGSFPDRQAVLDAMLDRWRTESVDEVLAIIEHAGGDRKSQAVLAGQLTFDEKRLPVDMAVREWARKDPTVADRLRDVDNQRMSLLRNAFADQCADADELEARCLIAFCVAIGSRLLHADHPGRTREQVLSTVRRMVVDTASTPLAPQ